MGISITTLSENTAGMGDFLGEWGLCHCTDLPATSLLAQEFGEGFFFNKAGTTFELP